MSMEQGHAQPIEVRTLSAVWAALIALTAALVLVSRISPSWAVAAMLTLTPLKAGLVFYYFMHLKYENLLLKGMLLIALGTLLIFISMMFLDLSFRA